MSKYGVPDQVRSDRGGENTQVWQFMLEQHHSQSAVLVGSSTHNQRIERLWRDVHRCVAVLFADLFRELEGDGKLNALNEVDMFCLHSVFLPRINDSLDSFTESWNNHALSTSNNLTPNQLFIEGALRQNMTPALPSVSPTGTAVQMLIPQSTDPIAVPRSTFQPCQQLQLRINQMNMLRRTEDLGYVLYTDFSNLVGSHMQDCNECQ